MNEKFRFASGVVLFFTKPRFSSQRERVNGVYDAAIKRGWQIQLIEQSPTRQLVKQCIDLWHPIGALVDQSTFATPQQRSTFRELPTVLIGRDISRDTQIFDCSHQKVDEPPQIAFKELSSLGMKNFAFIGDPGLHAWSVERGKLFKSLIPPNASFFEYAQPDPKTANGRRKLVKWLRSLPLPCGCFLSADHLALPFYVAADEADIAIGEDMPVVSVDNNEQLCLSLTPKLSSIKLDFFQSGANGICLLEKRLAAPESQLACMTYKTLGLVRRVSSNRTFADKRVTKGMAFITEHGCESISVDDVAKAMGCGRRLAMELFRRHAEMPILDAIHKVRMDRAFSLLRNRMVPIDAIPFQCGYASSPAYLKTFFKKQTGMTMREWRKANVF